MKQTIICLGFLMLCLPLLAQVDSLWTFTHHARAEIILTASGFDIINFSDESQSRNPIKDRLKIVSLEIDNSDLVVNYQLDPIEEQGYYEVSVGYLVSQQEGAVDLDKVYLSGAIGRIDYPSQRELKFRWVEALEYLQDPLGSMLIQLQVTQFGKPKFYTVIDCDNPPTYEWKKNKGFWIVGGLGIAAIGSGQWMRLESNRIYNDLYVPETDFSLGKEYYDQANQRNHWYILLTYAGAALLATDLIIFQASRKSYKKELKEFEEQCNQSLSLGTRMLPNAYSPTPAMGLGLQFRF